MRRAHELERAVGMAHYVSDAAGVGGRCRKRPVDFRVRELEAVDAEPVEADPGGYPHVVARVTLSGWDTHDFANALSSRLGISRERVSWAGTKDKHAITTQLISVDGVDPADLAELVAAAGPLDGVRGEVVGRTGRPVLFGDLAGNAFRIVVRDLDEPAGVAEVTRQLRAVADLDWTPGDDWPEYDAGDGRDGNGNDDRDGDKEGSPDGTAAADVGVDWTEPPPGVVAVHPDQLPEPAEDDGASCEDRPTGEADAGTHVLGIPNYFGQQRFGTRRAITHEVGLAIARDDWEGAVLAYVGRPSEREPEATQAARAYVEETRDWAGAVERFPSALGHERAICGHLAEHGDDGPDAFRAALEALPTTLQSLFVNAAQSVLFNRILSERLARGLPLGHPVAGDVVAFRDADAPEAVPQPDASRTQVVDEDRIATVRRHCERGRAFVTGPLVGPDVDLAEGEPGEITRSVLEEAGIEPGDFDRPGEFHAGGTRRALLVRTATTLERLRPDALALSFGLPTGSYATVLLREYAKADPSALS